MSKTILSLLLLSVLNASASNDTLPLWMQNIDLSDTQECTLGYGRASSSNPSKEALLTAKMELGFFQEAKVESSYILNELQDKDGKTLSHTTSVSALVSGKSSTKDLQKVKNWSTSKGDYFSLVCQNKDAKNNNSSESVVVKLEMKSVGLGDKETYKSRVEVSIEDELSYSIVDDRTQNITIPDEEDTPDEENISCKNGGIVAPKWVCLPMKENMYTNIGMARVIDENFAEAYASALVDARSGLVMQLGANVQSSSTVSSARDQKTITSTTQSKKVLRKSTILHSWYNKRSDMLIVMLGMPERQAKKVLKKKKTDANYKLLFQAQKAFEDLERDLN